MQINLSTLISVISVLIAIISIAMAIKKNIKENTTENVSQSTSLLIELKYISNGIAEIKNQITALTEDVQNLRDKTIVHSESIRQLFSEIKEIKENIHKYHERNDT